MTISLTSHFAFQLDQPTDALLQFEAAALPEQRVIASETRLSQGVQFSRVPAQDSIGERIWLHAQGRIEVEYSATVETRREVTPLEGLDALPPHKLPGEAVQYLLDSRYCQSDAYQNLAADEFAGTAGGARIAAIRNWIAETFEYAPGSSDTDTDASDSFVARRGICRDFSHVLILLARASAIPARYVACYAPGVTPQDFHAIAEVYLSDPLSESGGAWHLVDATGMAELVNTAKIGVGRDAADVSFLTTFGPMRFNSSKVEVSLA
ncbi:MAG: transglutaminase family protein [Pseudomonadota bacterium]